MKNTILVIENDKSINDILNQLLSTNDYNTLTAYSGAEGFLIYNEQLESNSYIRRK